MDTGLKLYILLSSFSAHSLEFLYFRHPPLSWSQTLYGYYNGFSNLIHAFASLIILPILKQTAGCLDESLLAVGIVSDMLGRTWTGLCKTTWMVFLSKYIYADFSSIITRYTDGFTHRSTCLMYFSVTE